MSYNPYRDASPASGQGNQLSPQQLSSKVTPPGIALIVVGSMGLLLMGAYFLLTLVAFATGAAPLEPPPEMTNNAERTGYYVGAYGSIGLIAVNALFQIPVILGGIAMVRQKGRGMAFTGAVLSVVPCLSSSICLFGIPFGIWALIVLSDPNVKRAFN